MKMKLLILVFLLKIKKKKAINHKDTEICFENLIKQFNEKQAKLIFDSNEWEKFSGWNIIKLQLFQERVCLPFEIFQNAIDNLLSPGITTIGMNPKYLIPLYLEENEMPKFTDILDLFSDELRFQLYKNQ